MKSRFGLMLVAAILFSQMAALGGTPSARAQAALSPSALSAITLSGIPRQVAVNTKTNTLYVAQSPADGTTNETLSIVNGDTGDIVTIDIGTGFEAMAVNEATNQIYVSNGFGGLYIRDGQTGAIVDTIGMTRPKTIAVNPDNNRIYVLDNELLKVLDANTHTVISDPVSVGFASYISAINTKSMKLYAAYNDGTGVDRLRVFDIAPVTPVEVSGPLGILPYNDGYLKGAVDTQRNIVYVANTDTNVIYVIDGSDDHIIDTIIYPYGLDDTTGKYQRSLPNDITFDSTTNKLLVGTTNEIFTPNSNPPDNVVYQNLEIRNANPANHDYSVTASLSDYLPTAGQFIPKQEFVFNTVTGRAYFINHIVNGLTPRSVFVVQVRDSVVPTYTISGRVTDKNVADLGIEGVVISAGNSGSATSDKQGYYTISGVAAGIYTLTPSKEGYTFSGIPPVTVPPNATEQNFSGLLTSLPPRLELTLEAPNTLNIVNYNQYFPNPFEIVATIKNNGDTSISDVVVALMALPNGLERVAASTPATVALGNLDTNESRVVKWSVRATRQSISTTLTYSVSAFGLNTPIITSQKQITLPGVTLVLQDSDCDSLPDLWEEFGYNGVNLASMGSNKNHKDIFVYVDWLRDGNTEFRPTHLNDVINAFASAPTPPSCPNPDKKIGISLHIIWGVPINITPEMQLLGTNGDSATQIWQEFTPIRDKFFPTNYRPFAHYALFANEIAVPGGYNIQPSGLSDPTVATRNGATSFVIAIPPSLRAVYRVYPSLDYALQGTFMHELGHNLGLGEGGVKLDEKGNVIDVDNTINKPNHLSVMNYMFMAYGIRGSGKSGALFRKGILDYSRFSSKDMPALNESKLNEKLGLNINKNNKELRKFGSYYYCGGERYEINDLSSSINWDCDGKKNETSVSANINNSGASTETLNSMNEWNYLVYGGSGVIGSSNQ